MNKFLEDLERRTNEMARLVEQNQRDIMSLILHPEWLIADALEEDEDENEVVAGARPNNLTKGL